MKLRVKKIPQANNGLAIEGNQFKPLSNDTFLLQGPSHAQGGIDINYHGNEVEAEGGEPISINNNGDAIIFGNLYIPGSKTKFKTAAKKIGEQEAKATKQSDKANTLIVQSDPYNKYDSLSFNSGLVKQDAANQKLAVANQQKELLGSIQQQILDSSNRKGIDPQDWEKMMNGGKVKRKAKDGDKLSPQEQELRDYLLTSPDIYGNPGYVPANVRPNAQGTLAQRNNNPGNLRFNNQKGAVKGDAGFAKFNSYEEGRQALINDIKAKQTGKTRTGLGPNSSILDLMNVYSPASDNNDPQRLASTLAKGLGVGVDSKIGELDTNRLADLIAINEDAAYAASQGNTPNTPESSVDIPKPDIRPIFGQPSMDAPAAPQNYRRDNSRSYIPGYEDKLNDVQASILNDQLIQAQNNFQPTIPQQASRKLPSLADRNRLNPLDFLPEIGAILDRPDYVQGQQYNPSLLQPYQVSFQDRVNANQSTFNALSRNFANNPEALATLAGQNYAANQQALADEFRVNQGNFNQVMNQNNQILNDAQLRNIQLRDQQYERQAAARAATEANRNAALASISNKYAQNRAENNNIRLLENMFQYRPDENLQLQNYNTANFGQPVNSNTPTTPQNTAAQTQYYKSQKAQYDAQAAQARAEKASKKNALDFLKFIK